MAATEEILEANALDMEALRENLRCFADRLYLDAGRAESDGKRDCEVAVLPDPIGEVLETSQLEMAIYYYRPWGYWYYL